MKEFDLEKAKQGAKVCTRDGKPARIVCWDRKWEEFPLLVLVTEENGDESAVRYTINGRTSINSCFSQEDLMMATNKKVGWVNIYPRSNNYTPCSHIFPDEWSANLYKRPGCIKTQKVEWEE